MDEAGNIDMDDFTDLRKLLDATNNVDDFTITVMPGPEVRGNVRVEGDEAQSRVYSGQPPSF